MKDNYIQVQECPTLLRDKKSKALLNTDIGALTEHKNKRKLVEDVDMLKKDIGEIKALLQKLVA